MFKCFDFKVKIYEINLQKTSLTPVLANLPLIQNILVIYISPKTSIFLSGLLLRTMPPTNKNIGHNSPTRRKGRKNILDRYMFHRFSTCGFFFQSFLYRHRHILLLPSYCKFQKKSRVQFIFIYTYIYTISRESTFHS